MKDQLETNLKKLQYNIILKKNKEEVEFQHTRYEMIVKGLKVIENADLRKKLELKKTKNQSEVIQESKDEN